MTLVTVLLAGAALAFGLSRWARLPSVPVLIVVGLGLSASGILPDREQLNEILLLGLTFLVFSAGTELDPRRFGAKRRLWIGVGVMQFAVLGAAGFGLSRLFQMDTITGVYLGLGAAASSTLVIVRILQRREQSFEPFGRLVLGVLLVQDVLVIVALSLLSHLEGGWPGLTLSLVKAAVLVVMAILISRVVTPRVLAASALDDEILLLFLLAVLFAFVGLSQILGLPLVVGAFWAGFALTGFPVNGLIRGQLQSLSQFFNALFFVALGAMVSIPPSSDLLIGFLMAALVIVLTPPLVTILAERAGLTTRSGVEAGLLLSQTSEFSIVLILVGLQQGHVEEHMVGLLGMVTVLTMTLTPFLTTNRMTWRLMKLHPSRWQQLPAIPPTNHVLLIGCGETGRELLDLLIKRGRRVVVVDEDPLVVEQLRGAGVDAVRGDGADFRILEATGVRTASVVISTMRRLKDHLAILKCSKGTRVVCRVFEEEEAIRIKARGGLPVLYSHAAADEFLHWFSAQERTPVSESSGAA